MGRSVHILFVLDTWGLIGGTERYASVVVPALLERGHRITVLCRENQRPEFADVPVLEFPDLGFGALPGATRRAVVAAVRDARPDVVYVSAMRNVDANELLVELAPVVRYVHDHVSFCPGLNKYREDGETCRDAMGAVCLERYWLRGGCTCFKRDGSRGLIFAPIRELRRKQHELSIVQRSAHVLTNSRYMLAELLKLGFAPERTRVLHYFTQSNTPCQPAGPLDAETEAFLQGAQGAPILLTPARLTLPDKGVDFLLTALAGMRRDFRAVVAGAGPAEAWLRAKAVDDGVAGRVRFTGWMPSGAVETLYARADVVVCPSVWDEPFGLVGVEAMAHEKPVVAFDVGGIPDWLEDGENGYRVPRKDTGAMARALDRLADEPDLRRRLGERGRATVAERFGRERHLERLERLLVGAAI